MSMNYLPNDPLAVGDVPLRIHTPRPDRPSSRAGFQYNGIVPEGRYAVGTPAFLFWQCSESALAALETWEKLDGPLTRWALGKKRLNLRQDAGVDLNAYYDRSSLTFFHERTGAKTTFSGASTDVVAHEAGHALLDALRPDLWGSFYTEVNAFHEAFGDYVALVTAFDDKRSRQRLIQIEPSLWGENFLEANAEDLSDGVRRKLGASHPASKPRHAFNWFSWQLPSMLPFNGGPGVLTSEVHSFGRVFSGCLWDLIGNLWNGQPSWSDQALWKAARTAGQLLIAGVRSAPETPRFFQSVGQAMLAADQAMTGGANAGAINGAFAFHNVPVAAPMFAPMAALAGPPLTVTARKASLASSTRKDLLKKIGGPAQAALRMESIEMAGKRVVKAVHQRAVSLSGIDRRLGGVIAHAAESVLLGLEANRTAVLGALPEANVTMDEVAVFVKTLIEHDCVDFGQKAKARGAVARGGGPLPTHEVRSVRGKKSLVRKRYSCPAGS